MDERTQVRPKVIASYCFEGFVLPYMSCEDMVVFELKDFELEVRDVWHEYSVILSKKTTFIKSPFGVARRR